MHLVKWWKSVCLATSIAPLCFFLPLLQESSFSSLVCTEVQLSDVAVLFLGSESTSQVRDELSALQDWESKVKAVVVCVGDSDR